MISVKLISAFKIKGVQLDPPPRQCTCKYVHTKHCHTGPGMPVYRVTCMCRTSYVHSALDQRRTHHHEDWTHGMYHVV